MNAKSEFMGCKATNINGKQLEDLLLESNLIIANNNQPTYYRVHDNSSDILDWALMSSNMYEKLTDFKVLDDNEVDSDHYPFKLTLNFEKNEPDLQNRTITSLNYNKANWPAFQNQLNNKSIPTSNLTIDEINEQLVNAIKESIKRNIPKINIKNTKSNPLPSYLVNMIKHKKKIKNKIKNSKSKNGLTTWAEYNQKRSIINGELDAIENKKWMDFTNKVGKQPTSSAKFWPKIKGRKENGIKTLKYNNMIYHTAPGKANLFSSLLAETFSDDTNDSKYNNDFKNQIEAQNKTIDNLRGIHPINKIKRTK